MPLEVVGEGLLVLLALLGVGVFYFVGIKSLSGFVGLIERLQLPGATLIAFPFILAFLAFLIVLATK